MFRGLKKLGKQKKKAFIYIPRDLRIRWGKISLITNLNSKLARACTHANFKLKIFNCMFLIVKFEFRTIFVF